jgi:hypothetical protein
MKTAVVTIVALLILQTLAPVANFPLPLHAHRQRGVIRHRQSFVTTQIFAKGSKTGKGQGNAGGWPSTSGNPSGSGRSNAASKSGKAPKSLWEQVDFLSRRREDSQKERDSIRQSRNDQPNVPILFHGHYNFGPTTIVQLSQLISMYLLGKPSGIDRNRIYHCVKICFDAAYHERSSWEEPGDYGDDLNMLLATCLASNWFTSNQCENIVEWNDWACNTYTNFDE